MGSFLSTLILGLIAALIGAMIQQRTWRHRSMVELAENDREEARQAIEALSSALDKRLEAQRAFTNRVMNGSAAPEDVSAYKSATTAWMGEYSTNKSRLYHSFGMDIAVQFEREIQKPIQSASAVVGLGWRLGVNRLCSRDRDLFLKSEVRLSVIQYDVFKFLNELNDRVSHGQIGRSKAINNLDENNPEMISHLYLIRRLLGIEGNIRRAYW